MIIALVVALGLLIALVVVRPGARSEQTAFNERFPPISDDEFLARCPPGTNPVIAPKVRKIVSDSSGVESERIYPSSSFLKDLE